MAKKKNEEKEEAVIVEKETDVVKLGKLLIKQLNGDGTNKIAWNLSTDADNPTDVKEYISTGSTLLDYIIANKRNGGIPVGKISEFNGEEASGKSLLIAHLIAEVQRRGGLAMLMDVENAYNPDFGARLGVDNSKLIYAQPSCLEEVGETIETAINTLRARAPDKLIMIALDSIAATPCRAEIEGNFDLNMNLQLEKSKVLAVMMKKITETLGKERVALVFTNQLKTKIGVMYGDPMTTPGGKAVPYHASVRVRLTRSLEQRDEATKETYGIHTYAKTVKNRLGPPMRRVEFDIMFADGIDDVGSWFNYLHGVGEIEKADGWCYLSSLPSGKVETKGASEGKDRGLKFREKKWREFVEGVDPETGEVKPELAHVKKHVLDLLEKHLVVTYGSKPRDQHIDEESLMDAEAVLEAVNSGG